MIRTIFVWVLSTTPERIWYPNSAYWFSEARREETVAKLAKQADVLTGALILAAAGGLVELVRISLAYPWISVMWFVTPAGGVFIFGWLAWVLARARIP